MPEITYVRNAQNRRVHKAFREDEGKRLATLEGCNLDDAAHLVVLTAVEFSEVEPDDLCARCWPKVDA